MPCTVSNQSAATQSCRQRELRGPSFQFLLGVLFGSHLSCTDSKEQGKVPLANVFAISPAWQMFWPSLGLSTHKKLHGATKGAICEIAKHRGDINRNALQSSDNWQQLLSTNVSNASVSARTSAFLCTITHPWINSYLEIHDTMRLALSNRRMTNWHGSIRNGVEEIQQMSH